MFCRRERDLPLSATSARGVQLIDGTLPYTPNVSVTRQRGWKLYLGVENGSTGRLSNSLRRNSMSEGSAAEGDRRSRTLQTAQLRRLSLESLPLPGPIAHA